MQLLQSVHLHRRIQRTSRQRYPSPLTGRSVLISTHRRLIIFFLTRTRLTSISWMGRPRRSPRVAVELVVGHAWAFGWWALLARRCASRMRCRSSVHLFSFRARCWYGVVTTAADVAAKVRRRCYRRRVSFLQSTVVLLPKEPKCYH
jgi:hypothetical protein